MSRLRYLKSFVIALLLPLFCFNATAAEGPLQASPSEVSVVTEMNAPYYDAFNGPREDNWVYQLADKNELQPHCYISKDESMAVGKTTNYKGTEMTCIQVGTSSRIFWPTRWVEHCQSVGQPYGMCMMGEIKR
ncbi:hypothetical protein VIN01S_30620 [Vibrio inusitatus NBRC 102082]|uniref:Uncharacterized protein n=1 Tax=Vibrio inusitatus NBRC 102082 TaxID=1219070 RepID=A0A4Y3HZ02_9VIBR|nr:hypothetical protein [Vibrio inusitatus]GEA52258.1 hypothetical protein VIN01S_30620 [Vibrio inusitatus NBRC 102082]